MGFEAVQLFHEIPVNLLDNCVYVCILNACSHSGLIDQARLIFNKIERKTEAMFTIMVCVLTMIKKYAVIS